MCGICGFNWSDESLIKRMNYIIKHRGPDDGGVHTSKGISLGNRRLSVIDLSYKGHQPMYSKEQELVIVFNGEIWNYKELKKDLVEKSYKFNSSSDTEVVLKGYAEYGDKIFEMLDGMFATAIWDAKKQRLILARDKIGKKPLYYYFDGKNFIFASEIKAILEHNFVRRETDLKCLSEYLSLRYSPGDLTMFKRIKKLPPGSFMIFQNSAFKISRYFTLPEFIKRYKPDTEKTSKLISKAIEKRMIADVPIGVFLSGGLDSSTIVAYISKIKDKIKTFSISFNSKVDESRYARIVAKRFKTDHKEIRVNKDLISYIPEMVWYFDEPLADPAALPTYLLCSEVSKYVKVAISGEGGDEVFGGYDSFNYIRELELINKIPFFIRKNLLSNFYTTLSKFYKYPKKHVFLAIADILKKESPEECFKELFYFPFGEDRKKILKTAEKDTAFDKILKKERNFSVAAQKYYFKEWLPNDLLMKADKMSMAHSLELRTPFLDTDLIKYFAGLPYKCKYKRNLFKKTVSMLLPDKILNRKKQGFTLPIFEWFGDKAIFNRIHPFLLRLKERGIFEEYYIDYLIRNPLKFKNEHKIWLLIIFEIWYEIYIEKKPYNKIKI